MSVIVLDVNGKFLGETNENGKIRHFIKDKKVKIVKHVPFIVQIMDESLMDVFVLGSNANKVDQLPTQILLNPKDDALWNFIPIGEVSDNGIKQFGWYLNGENVNKYAFDSFPSTSFLVGGYANSDKSALKSRIISHANKFPDKIQLIGADSPCLEFSQKENQFTSVIKDIFAIARFSYSLQQLMMINFKLMEQCQVNNIRKVADCQCKVNYYELNGKEYQFDEIFSVKIDIDKNDRNYAKNEYKYSLLYPDDKQIFAMTIKDIYEALQTGGYDHVEINGQEITANDIKQTSGIYKHKSIIFMIDEMAELMMSDDYKSIDIIKTALGSIARLGRAAGVHLCLICQRPSGSTISTDLINNIQLRILFGGFDSILSTLMFDQDISNQCNTTIKGRGFVQNGNNILEIQTYSGEYSGAIEYF